MFCRGGTLLACSLFNLVHGTGTQHDLHAGEGLGGGNGVGG